MRYLIIIFLFMSCAKKPNWYNMPELEEFKDSDTENPLNEDNIVFKSKRIFTYGYTYMDKKNQSLMTVAKFNELCKNNPKIDCIDWANIRKENVKYTNTE